MSSTPTAARARFYDNPLEGADAHGHDGGLQHDLRTLSRQAPGRRQALRWLALGGVAPLGFLGAATSRADTPSDAATVFAWAEANWPQWFPPGASSASSSSYLFRHYAATDNYLGVGVSDARLYVFGRDTGYQMLDLGPLSTWLAQAAGGSGSQTCSLIPEETAGPYPGDGSNSVNNRVVNALTLSGIVRSDIRASVAGATGVAQGLPLQVQVELVNTQSSCAVLSGYAIYLWHCTRDGGYSLYSSGITGESYLRGVQETDGSGIATFQTIFPGCYAGRMPHIHFEVYRNLSSATVSTNKIRTSQMAFPVDACNQVYATSGYEASVRNFAQISFARDNVFSDGYSQQMATLTGDTGAGYVARLRVGVTG